MHKPGPVEIRPGRADAIEKHEKIVAGEVNKLSIVRSDFLPVCGGKITAKVIELGALVRLVRGNPGGLEPLQVAVLEVREPVTMML
jgi:hypothetical protein